MFNMETCHKQIFEIIVVDKIMKKAEYCRR